MEKKVLLECYTIRWKISNKSPYVPLNRWARGHGLNSEQFSRWENAKVTPRLDTFIKWREAAGLHVGSKCQAIASRTQKIDLADYLLLCEVFNIEPWS